MVDYSKWKNIEISDDEDETHPNIDTQSLFRWRHQARVERMEEQKKERAAFEQKKQEHKQKLAEVNNKMRDKVDDMSDLQKVLVELDQEAKAIQKQEDLIKKEDEKAPWNVDTISQPGFAKTVINKLAPRPKKEDLTDEEKEESMREFVKKNEKLLKQFGMLQNYDDSKRFLQEHSHLVCEDTANYMVIWCIELEMQEKSSLMAHVAHQCTCMQYIMELSKHLEVDPRACVLTFFSRIKNVEVEYKRQFDSEIEALIKRIQVRSAEKLRQAIEQQEEEERLANLGPGGLDPSEVFESLPKELQECFESRDVKRLQDAIAAMPVKTAQHHMKRCVDSGLWVPGGNIGKDGEGALEGTSDEEKNAEEDEETVAEAS